MIVERWPPMIGVVGFDGGYRPAIALAIPLPELSNEEVIIGGGEGAFGACCYNDGTCDVLSGSDCAAFGGHYQGDGTTCDGVDCSHGGSGTSGACCIGLSCNIESPQACFNDGGSYQGDDTLCSPNPCPPLPPCCSSPFVHGGRYYLNKTVRFIGTSHSGNPDPTLCCDANADATSIITLDPTTCVATVVCSGTGHAQDCASFSQDYHWSLSGSNCAWFNGGFQSSSVGFVVGLCGGCEPSPACPPAGFMEDFTDDCHGTCTFLFGETRDNQVLVTYSEECTP